MSKKPLCLLALWYISWIAIAMKFSKKNAQETKKAVEKNWSFFDAFVDNFIGIHKDIFKFFEQKIATEENIKLFEEYKKKALDEVDNFKKEATLKIEELKEKWVTAWQEIEKELKKIYNERQKYIDKAKELWEEYKDEATQKWKEYLAMWQEKLEETWEEIKKKLK